MDMLVTCLIAGNQSLLHSHCRRKFSWLTIRSNGFKKTSSSPENWIFYLGTKATWSLGRQSTELVPSILLKETTERYMELWHLSILQYSIFQWVCHQVIIKSPMAPEKQPLYFLLQIRKFISMPEKQENLYGFHLIMESLMFSLVMNTGVGLLVLIPGLT